MPGVLAVVTAADLDLARPAAGHPGHGPVDGPPAARPRRGALRRRTHRRHRDRAARPGTRRRRGRVRRLRAAARAGRSRGGADRRDRAVRRGRVQRDLVASRPATGAADFSGCEVVVSQRMVNQRLAAGPIEGRGRRRRGGTTTAGWSSTRAARAPTRCATRLAELYGLDPADVRVVCPDVGGSFGAKAGATPEVLLLGELARRVGRPVRWFETRTENMIAMGHGRGQVQDVTIGGTRDGRITAYQLDVLQDAGAYPGMGALLPWMTRMMTSGVYDLAQRRVLVDPRGHHHHAAGRLPRRRPARGGRRHRAGRRPVRGRDRHGPGRGPPGQRAAARRLPLHDPHRHRVRQRRLRPGARPRARGRRLRRAAGRAAAPPGGGRRAACSASACRSTSRSPAAAPSTARSSCDPTARSWCKTGSNPYGQGHHTAWAMLVSDRLGIPMERIEVVHGDTDLVAAGRRHRRLPLGAAGRRGGARRRRQAARGRPPSGPPTCSRRPPTTSCSTATRAASTWPAPRPSGSGGTSSASRALDPLAGLSRPGRRQGHVPVRRPRRRGRGRHRDRARPTCVRLVAVDDAGRILNPLLAEGQVHGGLAQGAAQALLEEVRFDDDGNPLTSNFADYAMVSAAELPMFERVADGDPDAAQRARRQGHRRVGHDRLDAGGAQRGASTPLAHLGVRHIDMPVTPEQIWRALSSDPASLTGARRSAGGRAGAVPGRGGRGAAEAACSRRCAPTRRPGSSSTRSSTAGWRWPGWCSAARGSSACCPTP